MICRIRKQIVVILMYIGHLPWNSEKKMINFELSGRNCPGALMDFKLPPINGNKKRFSFFTARI